MTVAAVLIVGALDRRKKMSHCSRARMGAAGWNRRSGVRRHREAADVSEASTAADEELPCELAGVAVFAVVGDYERGSGSPARTVTEIVCPEMRVGSAEEARRIEIGEAHLLEARIEDVREVAG
jgi:hypothetical protein